MKNIFLDSHGRLRNGWWVLIFIGFFLASRLVYTPLTRGLKELGLDASALEPVRFIFVLLVTWACVRLRKEKLSSVGFRLDRGLVDGTGVWFAQISLALLFATSHWGNPDMHGATMAWATIEIFLGAVLLGLAYLRTGSLALPVGLHLGWNWGQGHTLGFGVSGFDHVGWFRPVLQDRADWLTGGSFGLESTVFAVVTDLIVIALLWRWKGSRAAPTARPLSLRPDRPAHMTEPTQEA
ncbi:MAG: lysostaphin resistance A-like protein [Lysobacter sp.]